MAVPISNLAAALANNSAYQSRVKYFMQKAATAVIGEASPTVLRHNYSVSILDGTASIFQMSMATVTNPTISAAINMMMDDMGVIDGDLEFVVNSLIDDFAAQIGDVV